jgi:hypothetical protein
MTIEAGALSLRITETGAEKVLATLGQIDAKARALGNATQSVKFNAASATTASGQLQLLGSNLTKVTQAANTATPALQQHAKAQSQLAQTTGAATNALLTHIGTYLSFRAAVRVYDAVTEASDRQEMAQRKLSATARLTGQSLATITNISNDAQNKFKISGSAAADLTQNFVKLAGRAGNVAQTGQLMAAWMDLAAAQGLSLSDVLTGINSTLVGQDEGLNRLGLANPSNIWKQWADAAGTTVAKMTEQQKWQAIVNAVTAEGAKVQGEYAKRLETTAGKQQAFNAALELTAASFGKSFAPAREFFYETGTQALFLLRALNNVDDTLAGMGQKFKLLGLLATGNIGGFTAELMKLDNPAQPRFSGPAPGTGGPKRTTASAPPATPKPRTLTPAEKKAADLLAKAMGVESLGVGDLRDRDSAIEGGSPANPQLVGVDSKGMMKGVKAIQVVDKELTALGEKLKAKGEMLTGVAMGVAESISGALADGFNAAFSGDDNFFAALGKSLLSCRSDPA